MNVPLGETYHFDVPTIDPATNEATNASGDVTYAVYEESTDAAILSGTMTLRTGKTGHYRASFEASTGNGFEAGKFYHVAVIATVAGVDGFDVIRHFRVVAAESVAGMPKADAGAVFGDANAAEGLKDIGFMKYDEDAILVDVDNVTLNGIFAMQAAMFAEDAGGLWATAHATSVARRITDNLNGFTAAAKAELQQEATDAINAYDGPTNAEMEARTLAAAEYATATNLAAVKTDTGNLVSRITSGDISTMATRFLTMIEADGASGYQYTTLSLENAPAGEGGGGSLTTSQNNKLDAIYRASANWNQD